MQNISVNQSFQVLKLGGHLIESKRSEISGGVVEAHVMGGWVQTGQFCSGSKFRCQHAGC
jgi:hypothetical protein